MIVCKKCSKEINTAKTVTQQKYEVNLAWQLRFQI